jgi:secondary thiamine-phosphate synthase enzyme
VISELGVRTESRAELRDITGEVKTAVRESGVESGLCHLFVPHTTAGITVNENYDPSVRRDILHTLATLVPSTGVYLHREGNADAHIKSSLMGHSATLMIESGKLVLGTWQGVFFAEFDGPRSRSVLVKITPDP